MKMNAQEVLDQQVYVITEQRRHLLLLRELLKPEMTVAPNPVDITWAGGFSSIESTARSLLFNRQRPIAVVFGVSPEEKQEQEDFLKASLAQVGYNVPCRVLPVVPEIEWLLFRDMDVVHSVIGRKLSPEEREMASEHPYGILRRVLKHEALQKDPTMDPIVAALTDFVEEAFEQKLSGLDLTAIRESEPIRELRGFIAACLQQKDLVAA